MSQTARLFGPRRVGLAELTDKELLEEVNTRRARRTGPPTVADATVHDAAEDGPTAAPRQVRQWLANLELPAHATLQDVERAYDALREKYEPIARDGEGKRRATAQLLLASLRTAYEKLRGHFDSDAKA